MRSVRFAHFHKRVEEFPDGDQTPSIDELRCRLQTELVIRPMFQLGNVDELNSHRLALHEHTSGVSVRICGLQRNCQRQVRTVAIMGSIKWLFANRHRDTRDDRGGDLQHGPSESRFRN